MVDNEAANRQVNNGTENETPLFVRILLSAPYSFGLAIIGGATIKAAVRHGLLWPVYVGVCFLVPFGLFLICLVVQIVAMILWRFVWHKEAK